MAFHAKKHSNGLINPINPCGSILRKRASLNQLYCGMPAYISGTSTIHRVATLECHDADMTPTPSQYTHTGPTCHCAIH